MAGTEGFRQEVQKLAAYFYADNEFLTLTCTSRLHQHFYTLKQLFDLVGLHTNVVKMVRMACQPCLALRGHSVEAYGLHMTGEGHTNQEWLQQRFQCLERNAYLAADSLDYHRQV